MRVWVVIGVTAAFIAAAFTARALDWVFWQWWMFGLSLGCLLSPAAFITGWRASTLPSRHRRVLFSCAAFASLVTAFPVALTGLFMIAVSGYCEDSSGPCTPDFVAPIGVAVLGVAGVLLFILVRSISELRRIH